MSEKRKNIAVLFGGRSVEHEISIITGLEILSVLDPLRYNPIPVYINLEGRWFSSEDLLEKDFYRRMPASLSEVQEVSLLPIPGIGGLAVKKGEKFLTSKENILPVDVYLPAFHGQFGEDGCIQGLLEMAEVAYTSSPVLSSAIAMNKYVCKMLLSGHGIPVLPGLVVEKEDCTKSLKAVLERILSTPGFGQFPLFIKPCNLGSSIGISKASDIDALSAALAKVFKYDSQALIEPCITNMFEINVSVIKGEETRTSVVEIPVAQGGTLTYEEKYMKGGKKGAQTSSQGMASLVRVIDPGDLDPTYKNQVQEYALKAFKVLGCSGVARFDFMVDTCTGNLYFNELNPLPGSFAYYLWAKSKPRLLYTEMLDAIIQRAEFSLSQKLSLEKNTGFRALFR